MSMKCPTCQSPTKVIDTRETKRIRQCTNDHCQYRFTTHETLVTTGEFAGQLSELLKRYT
jgi:transcriptional regulator NrdR family protein